MAVRPATDPDARLLGDLFERAVRSAGPSRYTPAQVDAWAAAASDRTAFGRRMLRGTVLLAEDEGEAVGFAALGEGACGVGRALLEAVLAEAEAKGVRRLHAEASVFSLPLFLAAGFCVAGTETVERGGVRMERTLVERDA